MPQSHSAGQPTARRGRVKEQEKPHDLCDLQDVAILTTEPQLGRVPLGNIITLCLFLSDTNIVNVLYMNIKHVTTWSAPFFAPGS